MLHQTHCDFHLGDNLVHLHFLRKQAIRNPGDTFFHYVHECHLEQLREAIEDLTNISLYSLDTKPSQSINVWKNAGDGTDEFGFFERHPNRNDFAGFHLEWFAHLSDQMGLPNVFTHPADLLFDYPAIQRNVVDRIPEHGPTNPRILFINSRPCSGQCMAYDSVDYFDPLIAELATKHPLMLTQPSKVPNIPCTTQTEMTISEIGALSLRCVYVIGVATGPLWPTFNIWNQQTVLRRIVMLGNGERLNLGANVRQVSNLAEMRLALTEEGLL